MRVRLIVTVSIVGLLGAACTGSGAPAPIDDEAPAIPTESLLLGTDNGPVVVQVPSGSVLFGRPGAVASLGGTWVLDAAERAGSTVLRTRDGATGEMVAATRVAGSLDVRIVSESGRAVALMEPLPSGWDPAVPLPRERTTIVVADPTGERQTRRFDLAGNFEPEAFSSDDDRLYLIQHLPAETPSVYRVTVLDLRRGEVRPVFGPFKGPAERMPGTRLDQLLSADAGQLYTLYSSSQPGYAPHQASVASDAAVSFVHVLSLREGWAHCVGLPRSMWDRPSSEQALATTPDGFYLFVIDAGRDVVAVMHTGSLDVRSARISLPATGTIDRTTAQTAPDGRTLYVAVAGENGSTVSAFDVSTFELLATWSLDGSVSGLGVSSDGEHVYAALDGRVAMLDAVTGGEVGTVPLPTDAPVTRVTPLAA